MLRGGAVGRSLRIGDRQAFELPCLQHVRIAVDDTWLRAPEHQGADRIGEAAAGDGETVGLELLGSIGVGREEQIEGRPLADLRVERTARARARRQRVAARGLVGLGKLLQRAQEIGGDRTCSSAALAGVAASVSAAGNAMASAITRAAMNRRRRRCRSARLVGGLAATVFIMNSSSIVDCENDVRGLDQRAAGRADRELQLLE